MTESPSVIVLSAEIRVLQVGNGQITPSMYRQLDDVGLEGFEAFGRVKDNKLKLGRGCSSWWAVTPRPERWSVTTHPPADWPTRAAPSELSHWLVHTQEYVHHSYPVAEGPDRRSVVWTVNSNIDCPNEFGWHVSQKSHHGSRFGYG